MKYVDPYSTKKAEKDQIINFYENYDFLTIASRKKKVDIKDKLSNDALSSHRSETSSEEDGIIMGRKTSYYEGMSIFSEVSLKSEDKQSKCNVWRTKW